MAQALVLIERTPWRVLAVPGTVIESDFPFDTPLQPSSAGAELSFTCADSLRASFAGRLGAPLWSSLDAAEEGAEGGAALYRTSLGHLLRVEAIGDYWLEPNRVVCVSRCDELRRLELCFLGPVLTLWLELRGTPVAHAAAVAVGDGAVGLLGHRGSGKSTLAGEFVAAGHRLLSDDLLPLECHESRILALPGYPQMKLWPDSARRLVSDPSELEPVRIGYDKRRLPFSEAGVPSASRSGSFCAEPLPLTCLYLLDRSPDHRETRIVPFAKPEALFELVRNSSTAPLLRAAGVEARRLEALSEVVSRVPFCQLSYPSDLDRLPEVRAALLDDLVRD